MVDLRSEVAGLFGSKNRAEQGGLVEVEVGLSSPAKRVGPGRTTIHLYSTLPGGGAWHIDKDATEAEPKASAGDEREKKNK